jgi:hypothetical protein
MRGEYRLAVYVLVTAIIEGPSILILYSYGYPSNPSSMSTWAFLIVYNLYFVLLALSAIGGPSPNQGPRDMSLDLVWGVVSMFIVVTVIGEAVNWLGENIIEITGTEKEISRFKKRLNSAVHDFVDETYSSKQVPEAAKTRIKELYTEHPELVDEYLSETLERIKNMGTTKTATRVEMLVNELHDKTKNEQSSERKDALNTNE